MTFSANLLYFPQFMTMYFADVGVWQFMRGHKWLLKKAATHWVDACIFFRQGGKVLEQIAVAALYECELCKGYLQTCANYWHLLMMK